MPQRLPRRLQKLRAEETLEKRILTSKGKKDAVVEEEVADEQEEPRLSPACMYFLMFVLFGR